MDAETRKKISRTMKGRSNFEGHSHTHADKIAISSSMKGKRNAADHKWAVNKNTGKETRVKGGGLPSGSKWGRTGAFKQWIQQEEVQLQEKKDVQQAIDSFVIFAQNHLGLDSLPQIEVNQEKDASKEFQAFGGFFPEEQRIELNTAGRHTMDVLRTLAHELVHYKQSLREPLPENAGDTGSPYENEANALAGVMMREYGRANSHLFLEDKSSDRLQGTNSLRKTYQKDTPGQQVRYTPIPNGGTVGTVPAIVDQAAGNIQSVGTVSPRIRKPIHSKPGTRKFYREDTMSDKTQLTLNRLNALRGKNVDEMLQTKDIPAYLRKARGDKPLTVKQVRDDEKAGKISDRENLAKARGIVTHKGFMESKMAKVMKAIKKPKSDC